MRQKTKIILLYLCMVIVYGMIAMIFTSTVHVEVDEEIYIALAKSFHYNGRFEYGNQLLNYSCVLYSMLISLAYYFYSPTTILFSMRLIGVIVMCSAVFPVYLLAKDILKDEKKAFSVSLFLSFMPYMFDSAYIMQEVLAYPLFMWTLYFLTKAYTRESKSNRIFIVLAAIASVLCVFTKTYMFFIPITLNLCVGYYILKKITVKEYLVKTIVYDGIYIGSFIGMNIGVLAVNEFQKGSNHYTSQISNLFPIGIDTFISGAVVCAIYLSLLIINTGILPLSIILEKWFREKNKSWIGNFIIISLFFLVVEIVFMIVLTEEGTGTLPHKFLFRYFQIFVPPVLILFTKYQKESKLFNSFKSVVYFETVLCIALVYFLCIQGKTRQAIIDGHLFLFLENVSKYIFPYADVIAVLILMLVIAMIYFRNKKEKECLQIIGKVVTAGIVLFWCVQVIQLPYYNNVVAGGKQIQADSIKIAEYLNDESYEYVYYVYKDENEETSYIRNFYGYIRQPYQIIHESNVREEILQNSQVAFISGDRQLEGRGLKKADLGNEVLFLYVPGE